MRDSEHSDFVAADQAVDTKSSRATGSGRQMSKGQRRILSAIAAECGDGVAEMSMALLAERAGVSLRSAKYAVKALSELEAIVVERGNGRGHASAYGLGKGAKRVQNCTVLKGAERVQEGCKRVQNCTVSRARVPNTKPSVSYETSGNFLPPLRSGKKYKNKKNKNSFSFFSKKFSREIFDAAREALAHFQTLAPRAGWRAPKQLGCKVRRQLEERILDAGGFDEWCEVIERLAAAPDGYDNKFWHLLDEVAFSQAASDAAPRPTLVAHDESIEARNAETRARMEALNGAPLTDAEFEPYRIKEAANAR